MNKEIGLDEAVSRQALELDPPSLDAAVDAYLTVQEAMVAQPGPAAAAAPGDDETRMVIVVRTDLDMGVGKVASQVAHAACALLVRMQRHHHGLLRDWERNNTPKIVLKVSTLEELERIEDVAQNAGVPSMAICDAGRTQIASGSKTCVAVCATKATLNTITGKLRLL